MPGRTVSPPADAPSTPRIEDAPRRRTARYVVNGRTCRVIGTSWVDRRWGWLGLAAVGYVWAVDLDEDPPRQRRAD